MLVTNIILSLLSGIALHYYMKLEIKYAIATGVAAFILLSLVTEGFSEGFQSGGATDTSRLLRYGDRITIWSWRNSFMRAPAGGAAIDIGARLSDPSEIPSEWIWEHFIIEDANDPKAGSNSGNIVRFGDSVYLKGWSYTWVSPGSDGKVNQRERASWEKLVLESPDISGKNNNPVQFGDMFYLKTWRNTYISVPQDNDIVTQAQNKDNTCIFRVFDNYGQGLDVDWARRGTATQSSNYGQFPAANAIDGNFMTFNHTQEEQSAWWQVRLPKEVYIDKIVIKNRKDCCQDRLKSFDLIVMDDDNKAITSKYYPDSLPEYTVTGINRIGRIIRIQLREKNYLHLGEVSVYGKGVDYSVLLERPVVSDLITSETALTEKVNRTISNEDIPSAKGSISYMFFVKPTGAVNDRRTLLFKGTTKPAPHIFTSDGAICATVATTRNGAQEINTSSVLPANKWTHVALVIDAGVAASNGWLLGEFNQKPEEGPSNCCYAVHPVLRQYYYIKDQNLFKAPLKNSWDVAMVNGMTYMGELSADKVKPVATLFVNGRKDKSIDLEGDPLHNNSSITIGKPDLDGMIGGNFVIDRLRVFNYSIGSRVIRRESKYTHEETTVDLVRGVVDARTVVSVEPHMLPDLKDQCSISFWFYSERDNAGTKRIDPIFVKGNGGAERAPAMWMWPDSNALSVLVQNVGGEYWGNGVPTSKSGLLQGVWYHLAEVIDGQKVMLYVNGVLDTQAALPGKPIFTISPIRIGGIEGKIKDMRFSNFALSADEVADSMGRHPDFKEQEGVRKLWREAGCISNPFKDPTANSEWIRLFKSGNNSKLEDIFKALKTKADKGDKNSLNQCFGPFAASLYTKLGEKEKLLAYAMDKEKQGKKCLPTAPFNCDKKSVNDFDIRTHRDFYKYTLVDRVIPPAQSAADIKLDQHPDFGKFQKQLQAGNTALTQMQKLKDQTEQENKRLSAQLKSALDANGPTVVNSPQYQQLKAQFDEQQKTVAKIQSELAQTTKSLQDASSKAGTSNPEYAKMAQELQNARNLAAANIAQGLDLEKLRQNPLFKEVLQEVMSRMSTSGITNIEGGLQQQKAELEALRQQTMQELQNTQQLANDIFKGITGLAPDTIQSIVQSKKALSDNPEYQKVLAQVQTLHGMGMSQHPECQKLAQQVNQINKSEVDGKSGSSKFEDLKIQSSKCKAMFQNGTMIDLPPDTLAKMIKARASDPKFQALLRSIVGTKSQSDGDFAAIMNNSNPSDPSVKSFLNKVMKDHLSSDPTYKKILADMVASDPSLKRELVGKWRIEDHPEYNKFANEMRSKSKCKN